MDECVLAPPVNQRHRRARRGWFDSSLC